MSLDELLAEFAKTRSSELGDEIELAGRSAIQGYDKALPKKNLEFHQLWKQLALEPAKRTWCLDTVIDRLPKLSDGKQASYGDKSEAVAERLGVLATVPPDPRISRAMLALLDLRSPVMGFVDTDHALVRCLIAHADDRTRSAPQVTELVESADNAPLFQGVTWPAPATAKPRAKPASKRDLDALYAAVYAEPDSDEPREVLADALQEMNDPRGEFIALQLREHRGDASDVLRERARELCAKYGKLWLGPLRPITYRAEMRRGFLQRLELAGSWSSNKWVDLAKEPMLATVEELSAGQATEKIYAAFLTGAIAKTVRSISVFGPEVWKVVLTTPMPRLDHLANTWWGRRHDPNERFKTLIVPWLVDHPQITRLSVTDPKSVAALPKSVAARLRELSVCCGQTAGAKLWAAWPKLETLTITPSEATIRLVRKGKREYAHVILERIWAGSGPKLTLPKSIKRIELTNNLRVAKLMEKTYQRRYDVEIVSMPSGTITGVKG